MNFSKALTYPFANIAKVFSIVLVLTIAIAIFLGLVAKAHDWTPLVAMLSGLDTGTVEAAEMQPMGWSALFGLLGLLIVAVLSGFWLSGYSVAAIRSVMNDSEILPAIKFGRNVQDGFCLFISSLAYWLLFAGLIVIEVSFFALTGSAGGLSGIVALASALVTIVAVVLMGWAYFIGMARFAAAGDHRVSWQIFRNIRLARENWRGGITLLLYMIAFTLIYGVARSLVETVLGGFIGGFGMASITLSIIVYYVFNLTQHFSTQHLIAQYAMRIGIGFNADDDFIQDKVKLN